MLWIPRQQSAIRVRQVCHENGFPLDPQHEAARASHSYLKRWTCEPQRSRTNTWDKRGCPYLLTCPSTTTLLLQPFHTPQVVPQTLRLPKRGVFARLLGTVLPPGGGAAGRKRLRDSVEKELGTQGGWHSSRTLTRRTRSLQVSIKELVPEGGSPLLRRSCLCRYSCCGYLDTVGFWADAGSAAGAAGGAWCGYFLFARHIYHNIAA